MKNMSKSLPAEPNSDSNENQGEGNVKAARRYNESTKKFVDSGKVADAVRAAKPRNILEVAELSTAEKVGRSRSKK